MSLSFYQDIHLLPDEEVGYREISDSLFAFLHLGFVENRETAKECRFALSFPEYQKGGFPTLGSVFRVFAFSDSDLYKLDVEGICNRMSGYAKCTAISVVPECNSYLRFYRVQVKSNPDKLARRLSKRKQISLEDAKVLYKSFVPRKLSFLPYISLKSLSTLQRFTLFVDCKVEPEPAFGFSFYGLSINGTVPDF